MRKSLHNTFAPLASAFLHDRRAAILPLFGILVVLLIVVFGAAVDFSRAINAREKLSYAIDAAALTVAAQLSTTVMTDAEIEEALADSFEANLAGSEFMQAAIDNLEFEVDANAGTISVTSTASLPSYFLGLAGVGGEGSDLDLMGIGTNTEVSYSRFDVELALVLDVTGSMWSDMTTLRTASEGLVDILIPEGTAPSDSKVRISLVPYSQGVNLGDYADKVKGGAYGYSDGSKCVTERQDYDDGTDLYESKYTDWDYDYYDASYPPPKETFFGGGSWNCSSDSEMIPLSNNRTVLNNAIKDLEATGATAGQTGITWGWNSLSPNFYDVWPTGSVAEAYDDEDVLKFAVIMTDGDNNRYYEYVGTEEVRRCNWWSCWTQTVTVNSWREVTESQYYSSVSSTTSREMCEAMKAAGIEIFGVYFGSNSSSAGSRNMQSCASPNNYYQATSADELIGAFGNIAKKIQQIYVSG